RRAAALRAEALESASAARAGTDVPEGAGACR
ncbi:hypothetical protein GA0115261_109515, partial [Streptomyces sp. OspMP-M43]